VLRGRPAHESSVLALGLCEEKLCLALKQLYPTDASPLTPVPVPVPGEGPVVSACVNGQCHVLEELEPTR
jgi:hypothetical protein